MADTVNQQVTMPRKIAGKAVTQSPASAIEKDNQIPRDTFQTMNQSVQSLRAQGELAEAIRQLVAFEGTVSTAVFSFVEVAMSGWTVMAYETGTHQYNHEGTLLAQSVISSIDTLYDYTKGYADKKTFNNLVESCLLETVTSGGLATELVLNKQRLPDRINVFAYDTVRWNSNGDGSRYPTQESASGEPINLNLPNIFISEMHKHANKSYSRSMMEPAVNQSYYYAEFVEEMRRTVRRNGHGRLIVLLNSEKIAAAAPPDVQGDADKMQDFMNTVRSDVEATVSSMEPEDALISFDSAEVDQLKGEGEKSDFVPLLNAISGSLATSLKSSPSILGLRINGSQSLSNTESLIFLKVARSIQKATEDCLSRALTLAVRLFGNDVYVKFKFNPINLRPDDELEAFKVMQQDRIMKLLSVGFLGDDEAAMMLGTGVRNPNAPELSGTMFMEQGSSTIDPSTVSPNGGAQERTLQPDTPDNVGDNAS